MTKTDCPLAVCLGSSLFAIQDAFTISRKTLDRFGQCPYRYIHVCLRDDWNFKKPYTDFNPRVIENGSCMCSMLTAEIRIKTVSNFIQFQ